MNNDYKNIIETTPIPSSRRLFGGFIGLILGLLISLIIVGNLFAQSGLYVILIIFSALIIIGGVVGWVYYEKTRRSPYAYVYQLVVMLIFFWPASIIVIVFNRLYLFFLFGIALGTALFILRKKRVIEELKKQGLLKSILEQSKDEEIEYSKTVRYAIWSSITTGYLVYAFLEKSTTRDSIFVILVSGISIFSTLLIITLIKLIKRENVSS